MITHIHTLPTRRVTLHRRAATPYGNDSFHDITLPRMPWDDDTAPQAEAPSHRDILIEALTETPETGKEIALRLGVHGLTSGRCSNILHDLAREGLADLFQRPQRTTRFCLPLRQMVQGALTDTPKTARQIADELGVDRGIVSSILSGLSQRRAVKTFNPGNRNMCYARKSAAAS